MLEVIESTDSKSLLNSSHVSSNVGCTSLALPSGPACALAACTHGFCSAPSAVVPLCMHVGDTCACINSWSGTVSSQGPTGRRCTKGGVSGSAGRRCTGAGCRFTSREATRHRYQAGQGLVWTHFPSTRRLLVSNSCHLDMDWKSGNL